MMTEKPFYLCSREYKPDLTVLDLEKVTIGSQELLIIAGPCAVESEEQMFATAAAGAGQYTALVGHALFSEKPGPLSDVCLGRKVALITNAGIPHRHLDVVHFTVAALAKSTYTEFIHQSESQKQMDTVLHLAQSLLDRFLDHVIGVR